MLFVKIEQEESKYRGLQTLGSILYASRPKIRLTVIILKSLSSLLNRFYQIYHKEFENHSFKTLFKAFSNLKTNHFRAEAVIFFIVPIKSNFKWIKGRRGHNILRKTVPCWYDPIQEEIMSHRNGLGKSFLSLDLKDFLLSLKKISSNNLSIKILFSLLYLFKWFRNLIKCQKKFFVL